MIHEVRVSPIADDPYGHDVHLEAQRVLDSVGLTGVSTTTVYRLEGISDDEAILLADRLLTDPISQRRTINQPPDEDKGPVVEVANKPGVMDPAAGTLHKAARDLGVQLAAATTSTEYTFHGDVSHQDVHRIVSSLLCNKTVQQVVKELPDTLLFEGSVGPVTTIPIRGASAQELATLSKDKLFLDHNEMLTIQKHFNGLDRDPTDVELEIIAARWSEHCGHKTFNAELEVDGRKKAPLFTRIKETAQKHFKNLVVSAFGDNSGVVRFYKGYALNGKVETHNSPSALDPYGGAMTGSGGVFRDIVGTGQGARTIISTDMFCFAPTDIPDAQLPPGTLRPDYLQHNVVCGVRDYGNRMGIPTANGSFHYDKDFRAKPTVIVGAYGILPESRAQQGIPEVGDLVVIVGGRTGRDGIHGATFSSGEMTDRTATVNSSAVQIGNPIEEKRMFDALLEARDHDTIRALTDCGAAGFSSAIGELGEHTGVTVDISQVPLKYQGLAPWEIWLSESQERMVMAVPPDKIEEFMAIQDKYNVEAVVLGSFDGSHTLTVNYGDQNVAELDYDFLMNGLPQRKMQAHWEAEPVPEVRPSTPETAAEWTQRLKAVLAHGNVCSKEPVVQQYDHGVQGGTIVPPFGGTTQSGPNDALVMRPLLGEPYGVVQSHGMNPTLNRLDPYEGSVWAFTEALANYTAVGGDPRNVALINNYIWPFPDKESLGSLDRSVDAVTDMMDVTGAPVVSGKDSLSSTYRGKDGKVIKIPPVLCISAFGPIPDVEKTTTSALKKSGSTLVLVGAASKAGMGGSTYYDVSEGSSNQLPLVDKQTLPATLQAVHQAIVDGHVNACHDVSEGGAITTVSEMCFGNDLGAELTLPAGVDAEALLFSETAGCFVVEVANEHTAHRLFGNVPHTLIGRTTEKPEIHAHQGKELFKATVAELKAAWQSPLQKEFHAT
jgi:phosphoribosylformylglycinamidine synthase subunit PurSL